MSSLYLFHWAGNLCPFSGFPTRCVHSMQQNVPLYWLNPKSPTLSARYCNALFLENFFLLLQKKSNENNNNNATETSSLLTVYLLSPHPISTITSPSQKRQKNLSQHATNKCFPVLSFYFIYLFISFHLFISVFEGRWLQTI